MTLWRRLVDGLGGRRGRSPDFLAEALELEASGDFANALTSYRLALRERPDDLRVLQNIAIAYSRAGQPDEAIRAYRRALTLDGTLAGAHYGLAFLLIKRGEPLEAQGHLEAFLALPMAEDEGSARFRSHAHRTLQELRRAPVADDDPGVLDGPVHPDGA
jgi:Flp pilus assembly protein TadD